MSIAVKLAKRFLPACVLRYRSEPRYSTLGQPPSKLLGYIWEKTLRVQRPETPIGFGFFNYSGELAVAEGSPVHHLVANKGDRIKEIRELNAKLGAIDLLENISTAFRWTSGWASDGSRPTYYLLKYDRANSLVSVEPYSGAQTATTAYDTSEADAVRAMLKNNRNIVLVDADKIDNLKFAYPNYFGDVSFLKASLKRIVERNGLKEFELNRPKSVNKGRRPAPVSAPISASWLTRSRFSKPKGA
jgi:hypothetical protein